MTERTFPVVEIFGPTVQGEGPEVGSRVAFVRFGGCDYRCAWCDSAPAVLPANVREAPRLTAGEITGRVALIDTPLVILSGGNPVLHDLEQVVRNLHALGRSVSVETQGTLWKAWVNHVDQVVVSPKPPSSGMVFNWGMFTDFLESTPDVPIAIKIPCHTQRDVTFAGLVAAAFPYYPMFVSVVTLMGGLSGTYASGVIDTTEDILRRYEKVMEWTHSDPRLRMARILPQVHALVWGHERGH